MINNRQAGRRNRGRNNGRQNGGNRGGDNGNRIDNRARGNAPQLLEKYRNMARDAQLAGDRVNTEYYLQFADHYFRVIADNRARQEEQQSRFRRPDDSSDYDADHGDSSFGDDGGSGYGAAEADDRHVARGRPEAESGDEEAGEAAYSERDAREEDSSSRRGQRGRKPRPPRDRDGDGPGFDVAVLPPAIARADNDSDESGGSSGEEATAPRRRGRRPRAAAEAAE